MKKYLYLLVCLPGVALAGTQTNSPAVPGVTQEIGLHSGRARFSGDTRQVVYWDHVVVTNWQGRLTCERLTIDLPSNGDSQPTNAVAETNLDLVCFDKRGETNHTVADKGIYTYGVVNAITNKMLTFTGHVTNTTTKYWTTGEPITYNMITGDWDFGTNYEFHSIGTNSSPFNIK